MKKMLEDHFVSNNMLYEVDLDSNQYFQREYIVMLIEEKDFLKLIFKTFKTDFLQIFIMIYVNIFTLLEVQLTRVFHHKMRHSIENRHLEYELIL